MNDIIHHLESKEEVTAYFEEVLRFKPLLLVFTRLHKVPYVAMCWQKIRVVVFKKSLINRRLLNIINKTVQPDIILPDSPFSFALYSKDPAGYIGEITLNSYLVKSNNLDKHGVKTNAILPSPPSQRILGPRRCRDI